MKLTSKTEKKEQKDYQKHVTKISEWTKERIKFYQNCNTYNSIGITTPTIEQFTDILKNIDTNTPLNNSIFELSAKTETDYKDTLNKITFFKELEQEEKNNDFIPIAKVIKVDQKWKDMFKNPNSAEIEFALTFLGQTNWKNINLIEKETNEDLHSLMYDTLLQHFKDDDFFKEGLNDWNTNLYPVSFQIKHLNDRVFRNNDEDEDYNELMYDFIKLCRDTLKHQKELEERQVGLKKTKQLKI